MYKTVATPVQAKGWSLQKSRSGSRQTCPEKPELHVTKKGILCAS